MFECLKVLLEKNVIKFYQNRMYRKARAAHSNNTGKYKILTEIDE